MKIALNESILSNDPSQASEYYILNINLGIFINKVICMHMHTTICTHFKMFFRKAQTNTKTHAYQNLYHVVHVQNAHFWGGNGEKMCLVRLVR